MPNPTSIIPLKRRVRRKRRTQAAASLPIDVIARVTLGLDGVTCDVFLTPGTVVTGVNMPSDNFFVNYSGGQTSAPGATIIGPAQVRFVLSDVVDSPATWEVDSADLFTFATGEFGGPYVGDVTFTG